MSERHSVQKRPKPKLTVNQARKLLALFCYYYPAYTFAQAKRIPYRDLALMLKVAKQEKAKEHMVLLNISTAPHTKKGKAVKELVKQFKKDASD